MTDFDTIDLAPYIEHALLSPTAQQIHLEHACEEADRYGFATVCIPSCFVKQAVRILHQRRPKVCSVIGFPLGVMASEAKLYEAQLVAEWGATELDVVINLGAVKDQRWDDINRELAQIVEETGQTVKAILEMGLLTDREKRQTAAACADAGVAYLKTSTGWNGGATLADVRLLREITSGRLGIKAAGGIRTVEQARALIEAGATRLGTSRGVQLVTGVEAMATVQVGEE